MPVNTLIALAKYGYLVISGLMAALGVTMVSHPEFSMETRCLWGGGILLAFGVVKLIGYCSKDLYRLAFQHDLASGLTMISFSIIIFFRSERAVHLVILLLGIVIMADAYAKVQIAFDSREFGIRKWVWIMLAAVVTGVIGFILVFRESVGGVIPVRLMGVTLIAEAILNCTTILIAVKIMKKSRYLR